MPKMARHNPRLQLLHLRSGRQCLRWIGLYLKEVVASNTDDTHVRVHGRYPRVSRPRQVHGARAEEGAGLGSHACPSGCGTSPGTWSSAHRPCCHIPEILLSLHAIFCDDSAQIQWTTRVLYEIPGSAAAIEQTCQQKHASIWSDGNKSQSSHVSTYQKGIVAI